MRWLVLACVVVGVAVVPHAARADEGDPDAVFEACKARRRQLTREAMRIQDMIARGRKLAAMPICRRFADRSIQIVNFAPAPPPQRPRRLHASPEVGLLAGIGSWQVGSGGASASFLELEGGGRVEDVSVVAFGGYARLANATISDGGMKVRLHTGDVSFGAGIGVEQCRASSTSELALVEGDLGYTLAHRSGFAIRLVGLASAASAWSSGNIWSARVALALAH
jgi:hypothetical protein